MVRANDVTSMVGIFVGVSVAVIVAVNVRVGSGVFVNVAVGVIVSVGTGEGVSVGVAVFVEVGVKEGINKKPAPRLAASTAPHIKIIRRNIVTNPLSKKPYFFMVFLLSFGSDLFYHIFEDSAKNSNSYSIT